MRTLTITKPDDWHLHLRDGEYLKTTVFAVARQFSRAIIMPNLPSPISNTKLARSYKNRILAKVPSNNEFNPLMTLYLTDMTTAEDIIEAKQSAFIVACKLYPMGATTHSDMGVSDISNIYPALAAMEKSNLLLLVHGEVTDPSIDIFDREKVFIDNVLIPLRKQFPKLKVVFEHITTKEAVNYVLQSDEYLGATITAHHLLLNRNAIFNGGIHPHYYCLPILKRNTHQQALIEAATSGNPKFFLGTDSAPHSQHVKENACGCAGIYTSHAAIELYAEAFDQAGKLDKLEGFASHYGADFYGLARNATKISLIKKSWEVPQQLVFGEDKLIPFRAGESIQWTLK